MNENTHNNQRILDETGGDFLFADLFIQSAQERAEEQGGYIPQGVIDIFYQEVEKHRQIWKKRREF